jgi:GINS complex subunit 2
MHRVEVPLWFALILKSQRKCSLVPPHWLNCKSLNDFYQFEVAETEQFAKLPSNWLELSKIFFDRAPDDVNDEIYKLKSLIQDLKEIRMIKVKKGLKLINESHLQLDGLSLMEINEIRPFVVEVMAKLTKLNKSVKQAEQEEQFVQDNMDDYDDDGY